MLLLTIAIGCNTDAPWGEGLPDEELAARDALWTTPITLSGSVLGPQGQALSGVAVTVGDQTAVTDDQGAFSVEARRRNSFLSLEAEGYRPEIVPVHLLRPLEETQVALAPAVLHPDDQGARWMFTGDVALGRRWLDVDESTPWTEIPPDDPLAEIQPSEALDDTHRVFEWVRPVIATVDVPICNLETPILDQPDTPYPDKPYVFFSLPESAEAIAGEGFAYVSLGNNHLYDYLEQGVADTLSYVTATGLGHSGGGMSSDEAFIPYGMTVAGSDYDLHSWSSISGSQYSTSFHATSEKGGSANLYDDTRVQAALQATREAGRLPVVQMHTGKEYTERPEDATLEKFEEIAELGPSFIIGHHPHVAAGFSFHAGVFTAHSLGNFAFDQDRLETMLAATLELDLVGETLERIRTLPIYLEDYRPRVMTGELASRFLRRLAWSSEGFDAQVVEHLGRGIVSADAGAFETETRTVQLEVEVPASGQAIVDLRQVASADESPTFVRVAGTNTRTRLGRDILYFGDFEDVDVDDQDLDLARWDVEGDSRFPCVMDAYRGAVSLCSTRDGLDEDESLMTFRHRVRVLGDSVGEPNKDLSLVGYAQGDNAGDVLIEAWYQASEGEALFGVHELVTLEAGDYPWQPFTADFEMPEDVGDPLDREVNARAIKLRMLHDPPRVGRALWMVDDLAIVSWDPEWQQADSGFTVAGPNPWDFLRVQADPGTITVSVTLERQVWITP